MREGYRLLSSQEMEKRDNKIIRLVSDGVPHREIAMMVHMKPSGFESRLQKLRQGGRLLVTGGNNG